MLEQQPAVLESSVVDAKAHTKRERLVSLDAFRGLTMMLMVLVNNAGSGAMPRELQHAPWNGWTIADTIFPSFLWIVGVAITLSLGNRLSQGYSASQLMKQVLRRAAILYALGLVVYLAPRFDPSTQRLLGVLQRIAICYLIGSGIYMVTRVRGQLIAIAVCLVSYWLLMTLVPVPGFGAGNLTVEGNLAHYVDWMVLGRHNYAGTKTWDPEGIISTIPSIATVLLGVMAGHILKLKRPLAERVAWLFLIGNCLLATALICNIWLPINKKLWTSSFALFMAALDFVIFAGFLWLVDGNGWKKAVRPFTVMGMNAIAIYMASELLDEVISGIPIHLASGTESLRQVIFHHVFAPFAPPAAAAFLYALAFTAVMYGLAVLLHRKQMYLRV
jgi:predicted acyltransferase